MEQPKILSLDEEALVEREREKILDYAGLMYDLLPFWRSVLPDVDIRLTTSKPRQRKPANLKKQLGEYSCTLFDTEAKYYPKHTNDETTLRSWLESLAVRIKTEVVKDAFDASQDFHCSEADRKEAIAEALKARSEHCVKIYREEKQKLLYRRAMDEPIKPLGGRHAWRPVEREDDTERTARILASRQAIQAELSTQETQPRDRANNTFSTEEGDPIAVERTMLLLTFKSKARSQSIKVTDAMIAAAAKPGKWNDRTMVTWWKRNDIRCKPPHDRLIRAVLAKDPSSIWPQS